MTLTTRPLDPLLDLFDYRGQRVDTFRFELRNGVTEETIRWLKPSKERPPSLSHNTTNSIKRQLSLSLGVDDTNTVNPVSDRVLPYAIIGGVTWPLGRYMFTDEADVQSTGGDRGDFTLLDEGNIIEQQLEKSFTSSASVNVAVIKLLTDIPIPGVNVEASSFLATGSFTAGQNRGQALAAYATQGDYFPYWMNNLGIFRMIRTKDPGTSVPDLDYDAGNKVLRASRVKVSDILVAPNRFVVISNGNNAGAAEMVGTYDVPPSAPHSFANRGFILPSVTDMQLTSGAQASAAARNLGIRHTIFERIALTTTIDPRHDSYNVIRYLGSNWLELTWTMELRPGGVMQHTMRKAYA